MKSVIHFIGAGPGDPELITVKGRRLLDAADVIVYAGSLVNPKLLDGLPARIHNSASMTLDQVIEVMSTAFKAGKNVVRLHTGDPAIYGAIREQMIRLDELDIPYEIIPGVSSVFAVSSVLKRELTAPEVAQTVIITRMAGKTPVPESESIADLARHESTMMILLSAARIDEVVRELTFGGYTEDTPAAVVERATWPEEKIITGTLRDIASKVKNAGITKTAIIAVGKALGYESSKAVSKLYDAGFSHGYRKGDEGILKDKE